MESIHGIKEIVIKNCTCSYFGDIYLNILLDKKPYQNMVIILIFLVSPFTGKKLN